MNQTDWVIWGVVALALVVGVLVGRIWQWVRDARRVMRGPGRRHPHE